MTLDLLKRTEKGSSLSIAEHDGNFTTIEGAVNALSDYTAGRINVKTEYAAVGNGIANDYSALQAAFNSGRKIYLPAGTYNVATPLTFDVQKGLDIIGESANPQFSQATIIQGTFTSSTGQPVIGPSTGYLDKDNTWVDGSDVAHKGYLHPVQMRDLTVYATGLWGHCVQSHNIHSPSTFNNLTIGSQFRGLLISQGFDIEVSNCRFVGNVFGTGPHDWTNEALMLNCFGFYGPGHGSLHTCSAIGWGVGLWIIGYSMSARGLRAETNYIGVRLGGAPNLGIDTLSPSQQSILSRSSLGAMSLEANHIGMRCEMLAEGSTLSSVTAQGSPVGPGRPFDSKIGIEIIGTDQLALLDGLFATGDFSHYPMIMPKGPTPILRSAYGAGGTAIRPYAKGTAGINGFPGGQSPYGVLYSINRVPVNFLRHQGQDWRNHTITAHSDLMLRGLKGLDVYNANIQPNNFGGVEGIAAAAVSKVITFRAALGRPQIYIQPTSEANGASTLPAGTYFYALSFIRRGGETAATVTSSVVVATTGRQVKMQPYGEGLTDAMRIYRGTVAGRWDGCFEVAGSGEFFDIGQAFTSTMDWPPPGDGGVPTEVEVDANYGIIATPSTAATAWDARIYVTAKATTGFTLNFQACPTGGGQIQWLLFRP